MNSAAPLSASPRWGSSELAALWAFFIIVLLIPLLSVDLPPLFDYPNHLSRMYVLADGGRSAFLAEFYSIRWTPLPNLAMDLLVPPLLRFLPLMDAGRVFLGLILLLQASGIAVLHRVLWGRWSAWPILGLALLYNNIFLWGFVNFLFGLGVMLWVVAGWLALRQAGPVVRILYGLAALTTVYFCHIEAFAILGLLLGAIVLRGLLSAASRRTALIDFGILVLSALPAFFILVGTWRPKPGVGVTFSDPAEKLRLLRTVFDNYHPHLDLFCLGLFAVFFVVGAATRKIVFAPLLLWWLVLFGLVFAALPNDFLSGASADHRIPLLIAVLLVVGTNPGAVTRREALLGSLAFACLFGLRMGSIESVWLAADQEYRSDINAMALLPPGVRLGVADPRTVLEGSAIPEAHIPNLAIPLRQAFVPIFFSYQGQQPVALRGHFEDMWLNGAPDGLWAAFVQGDSTALKGVAPVFADYDAVVFIDRTKVIVPPNPCLHALGGTPTFQLFSVEAKADGCRRFLTAVKGGNLAN